MAKWARLSDWTVRERWKTEDTSQHRVGHPPLLPKAVETALAGRLIDQAVLRNGVPFQMFSAAARSIAKKLHLPQLGGTRGHRSHFLDRNPEIRRRMGEQTQAARAVGLKRAEHAHYCDNLKSVGIQDKPPGMVCNLDETNVGMTHRHGPVFGPSSNVLKRVSVQAALSGKHASMLVVGKADRTGLQRRPK